MAFHCHSPEPHGRHDSTEPCWLNRCTKPGLISRSLTCICLTTTPTVCLSAIRLPVECRYYGAVVGCMLCIFQLWQTQLVILQVITKKKSWPWRLSQTLRANLKGVTRLQAAGMQVKNECDQNDNHSVHQLKFGNPPRFG